MNLKATLLAVAQILALLYARGAAQHFPTNEELRQLRNVAHPQLSPDGKHVLIELQDSTRDGGKYHLWLLNVDGSGYRQLTSNDPNSSGERDSSFLPDGNTVLYTSDSRLFRLSLVGGAAQEVTVDSSTTPRTSAPTANVDSYSRSPDGTTIAVIASDKESAEQQQERRERRGVIRLNDSEPHNRLYLIDAQTLKTALVPNLSDIDSVSWSAQSDRLLVLTHTRPTYFGYSTAAFVISRRDPRSQERLPNIPQATYRAEWLHSGNGLVLFAQCKEDAPIGSSDLYTFDLDSNKLRHLDAGVKDSTLSPRVLIVSNDDRSALISITHGVKRTIGQVDLDSGRMNTLDLGFPAVTDFAQGGNDQQAWVYLASSSISAPSVYISSSLRAPGKRLVLPTVAPSDWKLASSRRISWTRAGFRLEGLFYLPPEASPQRLVPLVVIAHGGPSGQFTDTYVPIINLLVAQGWAVFAPNPRGSTGYGVTFEASNKADLGNGDLQDIMAGMEELMRTQPIDPDRLAFIGQ